MEVLVRLNEGTFDLVFSETGFQFLKFFYLCYPAPLIPTTEIFIPGLTL